MIGWILFIFFPTLSTTILVLRCSYKQTYFFKTINL